MLATTHVITGAAMSFAFSPTPTGAITAFLAGTASHIVLDSVPHWGRVSEEAFIKVARIDGIVLLIFSSLFFLLVVDNLTIERALTAATAMFGAVLFDLDKPFRHFFNVEIWPSRLDSFLSKIQTEHPRLWPVDLTTGLISALFAISYTF